MLEPSLCLDAEHVEQSIGQLFGVSVQPGADVIPKVTVTGGSLSAARADDEGDTRFLQTDATMLPGNSGGPGVDDEHGRQGGLAAGLAATIRLSDRWSLSPEITPALPKGAAGSPFVTTGDHGLDPYFGEAV